jgi:hypothetical protein
MSSPSTHARDADIGRVVRKTATENAPTRHGRMV